MIERTKELKKASWIGIIGNSILAILKISIGAISGSLAVLADGIDSTTDVLSFIIGLVAAKFVNKPPNEKYPYGYNRAETIAAKSVSFIIFFAGAQLFYSTILRIINHGELFIPSMLAIYVTIFSVFGKASLAFYQFKIGKKVNSKMLMANGKNMYSDILLSLSVLVGLVCVKIFQLPVIDIIIALGISLLIMKTALDIFMETNKELMDGVEDTTIYYKLFDIVESVEGAYNPHRVRLRKHANMFVISLDIEVDEDITIAQGHEIAVAVEEKIKNKIGNIYDIMIHTEPLGNIEEEQFGVSRKVIHSDDNSENK
ncbi:MAG: cation diffusion facilitator family transporter [Bacteroidales bacterium]|jgi:cation diffusion facilitator family transporter|nr:cation diffusion facilitator family transporter [Bacteroidales bacterium]